jgi:hypothetical protein
MTRFMGTDQIDMFVPAPDPFEQLSHEIASTALKTKRRKAEEREAKKRVKILQSEADAPMKLSELEQKAADQSKQFRKYRAYRREQIKIHLIEAYPEHWRELKALLKALSMDNADALIAHVNDARWLLSADLRTRQTALSVIADAIIRLREENGYSPMDDSLPGEDPTAFEVIRDTLQVMT